MNNTVAERLLFDFIFVADEYLAGRMSREDAEMIVREVLNGARALLLSQPSIFQRVYLN